MKYSFSFLQVLIPDNYSAMLQSQNVNSSQGGAGIQQTSSDLPYDPIGSALMQTVSTILTCLARNNPATRSSEASAERMTMSGDSFLNRANDNIRYHDTTYMYTV